MRTVSTFLRCLFLAIVVLLTGACDETIITPKDRPVINWGQSMASRHSVQKAVRKGEPVEHTLRLTSQPIPNESAAIEIDIDVSVVRLEVTENGKTSEHYGPIKVDAKVVSNKFWVISGDCDNGPHFKMPEKGETPEVMVLMCNFKLKHGDKQHATLAMQIYGDGRILTMGSDKTKITRR